MKSNIPVLILGGQENAICLTRSFGKRNIPVFVSSPPRCFAANSRYCKKYYPVPSSAEAEEYWTDLLLTDKHPELKGSVIMVGSDVALEFVAHNKEALSEHYLMDDHIPDLHMDMLDKQKTLELGSAAGCPIPAFYNIDQIEDVEKILDTVMFPAMIKPIHSHLFQRHFKWKKYLIAKNKDELFEKVKEVLDKGLQLMVTEMIPGPDDLQSAYFTYMDKNGEELFEYTHNIIRRYPKNSGSGCLHISKKMPETAEMGKRFFKGIGYRGMGHIEFKHDLRDGKLKIIECNPRFSAAQAIVVKSGLDMAYIIYCHLTEKKLPEDRDFKEGVRRWLVLHDVFAFLELRRLGEITFVEWLKSIKGPPLVFAYFSLSDPMPFIVRMSSDISEVCGRRMHLPWSS